MSQGIDRRRWILAVAVAALLVVAGGLVGSRIAGSLVEPGALEIPISRVTVCRCAPDAELRLTRPDGIELAASLFGSEHVDAAPGVVLAHGNTPKGRKLPLYRVLATGLAAAGYPVLSFDHAGFGESDDPFALGSLAAVAMDHDLTAAANHLDAAGAKGIVLVGHSAGGSRIFEVGLADPRVLGIVSMGPPRRQAERFSDPDDVAYFWERARTSRRSIYGVDFPEWYDRETFWRHMLTYDLQQYLDRLAAPGHVPVLLMDGALESEADREYLARFAARIAPPVRLVTVPESDHYANSHELRRTGLVVYDRAVVAETLRTLTDWLDELSATDAP